MIKACCLMQPSQCYLLKIAIIVIMWLWPWHCCMPPRQSYLLKIASLISMCFMTMTCCCMQPSQMLSTEHSNIYYHVFNDHDMLLYATKSKPSSEHSNILCLMQPRYNQVNCYLLKIAIFCCNCCITKTCVQWNWEKQMCFLMLKIDLILCLF